MLVKDIRNAKVGHSLCQLLAAADPHHQNDQYSEIQPVLTTITTFSLPTVALRSHSQSRLTPLLLRHTSDSRTRTARNPGRAGTSTHGTSLIFLDKVGEEC